MHVEYGVAEDILGSPGEIFDEVCVKLLLGLGVEALHAKAPDNTTRHSAGGGACQ